MPALSSSPTLVILAGNTVTTWDCNQEVQEASAFYPHGDMLTADVAWNHNGQVLATCSAVSTDQHLHRNVVLTAAQSGNVLDSLQHNQEWKRPAGATTSLAFGGKSRYLCVGDDSGAVCLWDLKKKLRVRQFFHDGHPSHQVSLDPTDTYVLSLSSHSFHTYKLREGSLASTWTPQNSHVFTRYDTSTLEPQIAGIGTSDGSLLLYNLERPDATVPFFGFGRRHEGEVTGVAFSQTNDKLVASTATDGTLKFFDKISGTTVEQVTKLPSAITSLAMHVDGFSCAVGSDSGEVLVYDLRHGNSPLASMYAEGPVTKVQFSPPPKHPKGQTTPPSPPQPLPLPGPTPVTKVKPEPTKTERLRKQLGAALTDRFRGGNNARKPSPKESTAHPTATISVSGQPQTYTGPMDGAEENENTETIPQHEPTAQHGDANPPMPQQPTIQPRETQASSAAVESNEEPVSSPPLEAKIDMEQVRDVVRDEVEKLQDDLEEVLRNLHTDMIRQFHQQSQELNNALTTQLATIERISEENTRLREENELLKAQRKQHSNDILFGN